MDTIDPKDLARFHLAQREAAEAQQRASEAQKVAAEARGKAIAAAGAAEFEVRYLYAEYHLTQADLVDDKTGQITRAQPAAEASE